MKNYDICKNVNPFYFNSYAYLSLAIPRFFDEGSPEDNTIQEIRKLTEKAQYDSAIALAEHHIANSPEHMSHAFLAMQIFALWGQEKIPHEELLNYFEGLEEVLPTDVAVNFDKAALYVRMKKFNEAMAELKKARAKDPKQLQSLILQFWIFYFSGDLQWKPLWDVIKEKKLLIEQVINIVEIVEAIKARRAIDLYDFADTGDLHEKNKKLLENFPALVTPVEPSQENTIFVAADGNYLREYITTLIMSALEVPDRNFGIHVHVYDPMGTDLELLQLYVEKYPELNISYSYEKASFAVSSGIPAYFASMRFCRSQQIFETFDAVRKIIIVDADVILRKSPFNHPNVKDKETTLTYSYDGAPAWEEIVASFAAFSKTPSSRDVYAYLSHLVLKNFAARKEFWFIDQVALFDTYKNFSKKEKIALAHMNDLFGEDMAHTDEAYIWTYTNDDKAKDNAMNRERSRLIEKYGIKTDWNQLFKGKYGLVVANIYDEYVGRSLRTVGSWCDHEIQYLKLLLEPGDTVLEVGSNMGSHTLPLAKIVGNNGRVIGIEPQRLMFQTICASVAINSLRNVQVLNVACGEAPGVLRVAELDPTAAQNFGGYQPKQNKGNVPVNIITIDSLELEACKLIKMDIEGMEIEALKGAKETLRRFEPILFFESHGEELKVITAFLKEFGYQTYESVSQYDPMFFATTPKYLPLLAQLGLKLLPD